MKKIIVVIGFVLLTVLLFSLRQNSYAENKNDSEEIKTNEKKLTQTIENGTYIISSAMNQNFVLDVANNSRNSGANVALWGKNNQNNQKFNVTYLGDGYYKFEAVHSGKYLSVVSNKSKNEDNVNQSTYEEKDTQKWIIKDAGNGYYYIISKASSLYLGIYGAGVSYGTNIQLYEANNRANQKFKFTKVEVVSGTQTIIDGTYTISTALNFNQVIDVHGASTANNANVEIYTRNNEQNQKFKVEHVGGGYYKIIATHSGKALTVKDSSIMLGANVEQETYIGIDAQKWVIKSDGKGYYYIISKCNGLYLDLHGGFSNSGTNIEVYGGNYKNWQKFKFYLADISAKKTIENGNYVITSAMNTNKVIDVEGDVITNNANIDLWSNNGGNNQKFIITYLNDGYYTIRAFNSNKVLTIENNSGLNGSNIVQAYYQGSDCQKWAIQATTNGYYYIISKANGFAIDIEGGVSKNGTNVEVYEKNEGANQKFKFVKTEFSRTIPNGKYAIMASSNNKKVIDIQEASTEDGAKVILWETNGGTNQSFYIEYVGEGCYTIQAANSQKLLTVKNGKVIQQQNNESDAQKWIIQKANSSGHYAFRSKLNDYYLDIYYNKMQNGTTIQVYPGNEENSQRFNLEELNYKGIDVSKYQNTIDWNKVKSEIDFTIIRIGYRGYETGKIAMDPYYTQNIKNALANNIPCGVYFLTQAINETEGIEEAKWVLEKIKGYEIKYPIAVDTEWSNSDKDGRADWIDTNQRTKAIKAFCKTIKDAGYTPIIYASKEWIKNKLIINQLQEYDVWLAHYVAGAPDKKSDYDGKYTIWQYTSSGRIQGINTLVDMNICYKKYN